MTLEDGRNGHTRDWAKACDAWKVSTFFGRRERCSFGAPLHDVANIMYLCDRHHAMLMRDVMEDIEAQRDRVIERLQARVDEAERSAEEKLDEAHAKRWELIERERDAVKTRQQVYFIRCEDYIKIGMSVYPEQRLKNLRMSGNGTKAPKLIDLTMAELIATEPGGRARETALHQQFKEHRVLGEWFTEVPSLTEYITGLLEDAA